MDASSKPIELRPVERGDLDVFFDHMQDAEAVWMAAFTPPDPSDRETFDAHWNRLFADESIRKCTILLDGVNVGSIASFEMFGDREITYWIDRAVWGRGIATEALRQFLDMETTRPLFGRAAKDNAGSTRVLLKCGFVHVGEDRGFSNARNEEVDEIVLWLD